MFFFLDETWGQLKLYVTSFTSWNSFRIIHSTLLSSGLEIEALYDGVDFSETLTRARFEELNADLFKNTLGPVKQVLEDSGLKKNQVTDGNNVWKWHADVDCKSQGHTSENLCVLC